MTVEDLKHHITPLLLEKGFELCEITFQRQSGEWVLHLAIDRLNGHIDLDTTVWLSEWLSEELDRLNWYDESYTLDVSSPGAERQIDLDKLERFLNHYINIHLTTPYQGENYLEGMLLKVEDGQIVLEQTIKTRKKEITIKLADVDRARLAIKF